MKTTQESAQAVAKYLMPFRDQLKDLYTWNFKPESLEALRILDEEKLQQIKSANPGYERETILKPVLQEALWKLKYINKEDFHRLASWVIRDWGGIKAAKDKDTHDLIEKFLLEGENTGFERIASYSKVASLLYPERMIIYDARVAYSLNWILLKSGIETKYFPIPSGRNSRMTAFDLNVLIRLNHLVHFSANGKNDITHKQFISRTDAKLYHPKKKAYPELNNLIREVNKVLWNDERKEKLYHTEMLLFAIADRQIYEDITTSVQIKFGGIFESENL